MSEWFAQLTSFDYIVGVIFFVLVGRGIWVGFVRQVTFFIAMFSGFVAAGQLHGYLYPVILPLLDSRPVAFLLTYVVLFIAIYFVVTLVGMGLKKVMDISFMEWFDRTIGGLFGAVKGLFIVSLIFMILAAFLSGGNNFLRRSVSFPLLSATSELILTFVRDNDLRDKFIPREPAIIPEVLKEQLAPFLEQNKSAAPVEPPTEKQGDAETQTAPAGKGPAISL